MQKRSRGAIGLALALVAALVPSSHAGRVVAAAVPSTTCQVFPDHRIDHFAHTSILTGI
jgi:hypothetical protein